MWGVSRTPDKAFLQQLIDRAFGLDPGIRYAAFANVDGEVVVGGMRLGVRSYDSNEDQRMRTIQRSISGYLFKEWARNYGQHKFTVTAFEKLVLIQICYGDLVLNISAEPNVNLNQVLKKVGDLISKPIHAEL